MRCDAEKKIPSASTPRATGSRRSARQGLGRAAARRHHGQHAVLEEVERLGHGRLERDLRAPSGDHFGLLSGPAWVTSARTAPEATSTTEMSALPLIAGIAVHAVVEGDRVPSGDQSKLPTTNAPAVSGTRGLACASVDDVQLRHAVIVVLDA